MPRPFADRTSAGRALAAKLVHWRGRNIIVLGLPKPATIVLAVPVVQDSVAEELRRDVHELVAVITPADLVAIGVWYEHFPQLTDDAVRRIVS